MLKKIGKCFGYILVFIISLLISVVLLYKFTQPHLPELHFERHDETNTKNEKLWSSGGYQKKHNEIRLKGENLPPNNNDFIRDFSLLGSDDDDNDEKDKLLLLADMKRSTHWESFSFFFQIGDFKKANEQLQEFHDLDFICNDNTQEKLESCESKTVVVIGGGIHGASIARQLSFFQQHVKVILLEKDDFGSGTSQNSAKLAHGGLRYLQEALQEGDISKFLLVFDSLRYRRILKHMSPFLVEKLGFVVLNQFCGIESLFIKIGLNLYDTMNWISRPFLFSTSSKSLPWNKQLNNDKIRNEFKGMNKLLGCSGNLYYEYRMNDARLTMANILDAEQHGAIVKNYAEVKNIIRNEEKDVKKKNKFLVEIIKNENSEQQEQQQIINIQADFIVNAGGAYVYDISSKIKSRRIIDDDNDDDSTTTTKTTTSAVVKYKGCFIIVNRRLGNHTVVYRIINDDDKKKIIYMIPFGEDDDDEKNKTLIGTTDSFLASDPKLIKFISKINYNNNNKSSEKIIKNLIGKKKLENSYMFFFNDNNDVFIFEYFSHDENELKTILEIHYPQNIKNDDDDVQQISILSKFINDPSAKLIIGKGFYKITHMSYPRFDDIEVLGQIDEFGRRLEQQQHLQKNRIKFKKDNKMYYKYNISISEDDDNKYPEGYNRLHKTNPNYFLLYTDLVLQNDPNSAIVSENEIKYLLNAANEFWTISLTKKDVISSFAGIRSFKKSQNRKDSTKISRKHEIEYQQGGGNIINIFGGKLTTSLSLATEVRKIVLEEVLDNNNNNNNNNIPNSFFLLPLVGGRIKDFDRFIELNYKIDKKRFTWLLNPQFYSKIVKFYGSEYHKVLEVIEENPKEYLEKIISSSFHVVGEIIFAVRCGHVKKPEDFLRRRTSIELEFGQIDKIEKRVEKIIKKELKRIGYVF